MVNNRIIFHATRIQPNPDEIDYWVDLSDNPYGGSIKYYNGIEWVRLAASGGQPDLSKYYTKELVNILLNDKADLSDVDSKVDDDEVKDVIKDIYFSTTDPNSSALILFKYDGTTETVVMPMASASLAGIVASKDFIDFVKQHQLQELHTEMIDLFADIRAKFQRKLVAGANIRIDLDTNVISASGDISVQWDKIVDKPDFKPVSTSGDYNDLINKLTPGKDVNISNDNVITIDIDSDDLSTSLSDLDTKISTETSRAKSAETTLQSNIDSEASTARAAELANANAISKETSDRVAAINKEVSDRNAAIKVETDRSLAAEKKLQDNINAGVTSLENAIATEQNRAESAEQTITTNLLNEVNRSTQADTAHTNAISLETKDRKDAITTEVNDRNAAIKVESDRAKEAELALDTRINTHTSEVTAALALKADKSDTYTKAQVDSKVSGAYKVKGSRTFELIPTTGNVVGDVYNITNEFTLDGNHYDAGTNIVWTEDGWDALSGSFDTTAIENSISEVANNLAQEVLDRTNSDTAISNSVTAVSNRVTTAEGKLNTIQGDLNTTGSINKALKDAKAYTDSSVTTEKTRAEAAELKLTSDLSAEVTRAKAAETANTTAIQNEEARALGIEGALRTDVDDLSTNKVDKVEGKGLSTNDYTTAEKSKLAGVANNANNYSLPAATASVLGGVKIGSNITLADGGIVSITKANVVTALGVDPTTTYVNKAGDTMRGSLNIYPTSGDSLLQVNTTIGNWSSMKLDNTFNYWNISTSSNSLDGALQFRYNGADTTRWYISKNGVLANIGGYGNIDLNQPGTTNMHGLYIATGDNDWGRLYAGATGANAGYLELATGDEGTEPIYVRLYQSTTVKNQLILLDSSGRTIIQPNKSLVFANGSSRQFNSDINSVIHGGADGATSSDANLRFGSWQGIGWYPTYSGGAVGQGNNAMWLNVRTGTLSLIGSYYSNVATGTAPYQCESTTMNYNLNADMLDGKHYDDISTSIINGNFKLTTAGSSSVDKYLKFATFRITNISSNIYTLSLATFAISTRYCSTVVSVNVFIAVGTPFARINYLHGRNGESIVGLIIKESDSVYSFSFYASASNYQEASSVCLNKYLSTTCTLTLDNQLVALPTDYYGLATNITSEDVDWYGVSWSETSSNPDCSRIGNLELHKTLPILNAMKGYVIWNSKSPQIAEATRILRDDWSGVLYDTAGGEDNTGVFTATDCNIMTKIPEFWYIDEYSVSDKRHNLKICAHAKPGWHHHKEAFVGSYEGYNQSGYYKSSKDLVPTVNVTREAIRTTARANGTSGESKWNIYTYEEHRAICHLFLVEYATRNSLKAVNNSLTAEGYKQGGLGSGCTAGTVNSVHAFIPTGTSDTLGNGSGEVTWTDGTNSRKCNRYRGIENPFGHIWKHCDDIISLYSGLRYWYKCYNPKNFANNKNANYKPLCCHSVVTGYKTNVVTTDSCDFFAAACSGGSETTYWCDYNWDNTDTTEHCLLIGARSGYGGAAGLFGLYSNAGVGDSDADVGSRLTYLPWAE